MATARDKTRIIFTLSKRQARWLEERAEEIGISKSKLIRWLIEKNIENIQNWSTPEEMEALIRIARTKWIKNDWEDED